MDTTQSQQIAATTQTSLDDYSYYVSTLTESTSTTGTAGTVSTTTWYFDKYHTRTDTYNETNAYTTQSATSQTLSRDTTTIATVSTTNYSLVDLYDSTIYLSSQENAWTLKPLASSFVGSSIYRITDIYGEVSDTSFALSDVVPSVTVSTVYNTYMSVYSSSGFDVTITTGTGTNTGTMQTTSYNWTKWIDGDVWETGGSGVQGSSRIQEVETSDKDYNASLPSYSEVTGTGTNTAAFVDLVTHLLSSDKQTYSTVSKVGIVSNHLTATYYTWHGSRTVTVTAGATIKSTSTGRLASYAITGSTSNFIGYRSVTNEYTFYSQSVVTSTAWDEDWAKSRISYERSGSTYNTGSVNSYTNAGGYTQFWNTGADSVVEVSEIAMQYGQTGWWGDNNLTVITPVNANAFLGFGGSSDLHDANQYGWVDVSSAGETFTSYQDFKTAQLARSKIGIDGGNLILTDKCNMPWGVGTYRWSSSTAQFSTASTLLATYSSTTQTTSQSTAGTITTSTATFKYATYTLNMAHLVTGDFIDSNTASYGGAASYGGEIGYAGLMTTYSYSFEKEDSLSRDRTIIFPQGVYSITTNRDASQVGSGTYLYTDIQNTTVMSNGDEWYIEQELLVTAVVGFGKGVGYIVK